MADLIYAKQVVVPAQTLAAAPFTADISFHPAFVDEIEIVIPDGHAGLTGIALGQAHQQVIPVDKNTWITSNDEVLRFAYSDGDGTGNWQAITYNTDFVNVHTFYIRFFVLITNPHQTAQPSTEIPISDILEAGVASASGAELGPIGVSGGGTGIPTVTDTGTFETPAGDVLEPQAEADLASDTGLIDTVAEGGQEDTADMSLVQFGVAPPDFGPDAA